MANILATQSTDMRAKGEGLNQQADKLLCESWNERMWSDGEPIDLSATIDTSAPPVLVFRNGLAKGFQNGARLRYGLLRRPWKNGRRASDRARAQDQNVLV
jgi:hypothetical protein